MFLLMLLMLLLILSMLLARLRNSIRVAKILVAVLLIPGMSFPALVLVPLCLVIDMKNSPYHQFEFDGNYVHYLSKGFSFKFRVYPRKKVIKLVEKYVNTFVSCKDFHRVFSRVMRVIESYYNF